MFFSNIFSLNNLVYILKALPLFMEIEKIEGCNKFKMELELEMGNYTIGCGTKQNGIKKDFCVKNDEYIYIK